MELLKHLTKTEAGYLETLLSDPIKRLSEHSDIELTEEEIADALVKAKSRKSIRLEHEKNYQIRLERANELMKPFNAEELIEFSKRFYTERFSTPKRKRVFVIDNENRNLVNKLALYFTGNQAFNVGEYSLKKGILLMGNVRKGKTDLMTFFQKNKKNCYRIVSCKQVADDYLVFQNGNEKVYSSPIEMPLNDPTVFFQKYIGYCFDDLGTEEDKNDHGNKKNVMGDVITAINQKRDFSKFHITTNLDDAEIEARYGTRVYRRMQEMFNFLILDGKDRLEIEFPQTEPNPTP